MESTSRRGKVAKKVPTYSYPQIDRKLSDIAMICTFEKVKPFERTSGDGMEQQIIPDTMIGSPKEDTTNDIHVPQQVKRKELKFVPYEPYRAAVTPILPLTEMDSKVTKASVLKETHIPFPLVNARNPDVDELTQAPVMKVLRDIKVPERCQLPNAVILDASVYQAEHESRQAEKMKYEEEIKALKIAKQELENQFKIQTQVNRELKKLLVASMGEDMQSRVQFLSEDKARLAEDISRYSQRLLEDNEELERRAILCDVWRSKFLACSLMVDELAGWKALLSRNFQESKEAVNWLLQERNELKQNELVLHRFLKALRDAFDPSASKSVKNASPNTLLQVAQGNRLLAEAVHFRLLGSADSSTYTSDGWNCDQPTPGEELAQKVLSSKDVCLENLSALDSSNNFSRHKMCLFHARGDQVTMNCCKHCLGEIDVV